MSDMMMQEEAMNMSNEQAVQILIPLRNMMCDRYGCPISDAVFALDKAIKVLSANRPQGWILCSERLPEDLATVLVWTEGEDIGIAFHMLDGDESDFAKISPAEGKVIAWMPMPGPWEGADDES